MNKIKPILKLVAIIYLFVFVLSDVAAADVAFDAVGPSSAGAGCASSCANLSWSHTVSGSNRILVVVVTMSDDALTITSVTFNSGGSQTMTSAAKVHSNNGANGYVEMFYLLNPNTGTGTVTVTPSTTTTGGMIGGSVSFTGASGVRNATTNFGSAGSPTVSVTSATGNMVVDGVCNGSPITNSDKTQRWLKNQDSGSGAGNGAESTAAGASSVTMSYTTTSDFWGIIGLDLIASSGSSRTKPHLIRGKFKIRGRVRFR
jgi:hypothetical protein